MACKMSAVRPRLSPPEFLIVIFISFRFYLSFFWATLLGSHFFIHIKKRKAVKLSVFYSRFTAKAGKAVSLRQYK